MSCASDFCGSSLTPKSTYRHRPCLGPRSFQRYMAAFAFPVSPTSGQSEYQISVKRSIFATLRTLEGMVNGFQKSVSHLLSQFPFNSDSPHAQSQPELAFLLRCQMFVRDRFLQKVNHGIMRMQIHQPRMIARSSLLRLSLLIYLLNGSFFWFPRLLMILILATLHCL